MLEKISARHSFQSLDFLELNERQKWDALSFCRWTANGCIIDEFLVNLPKATKGWFKEESSLEQNPWKYPWKRGRSPTTRWWTRGRNLEKITVANNFCFLLLNTFVERAATPYVGTVLQIRPYLRNNIVHNWERYLILAWKKVSKFFADILSRSIDR